MEEAMAHKEYGVTDTGLIQYIFTVVSCLMRIQASQVISRRVLCILTS